MTEAHQADDQQAAIRRVPTPWPPRSCASGATAGGGCGVVVADGLVVTNAHNLLTAPPS